MKRIFLCLAVLSIMISCKKTSYVAKFDKLPQERAAEQLALVSNALSSSPNGWVATLPTQAGGGYGFYINFDKELNVAMYGDMTATSASVLGNSYYRVKQDMGTELVFDTYNYISILNDPNATIGGTAKIGYSSDVEFTFDKISGDTLIFIGKKFRQPFRLVKATATQKTAYLAGALKTSMDKMTKFFVDNKFPYIDVASGQATTKANIIPNFTNNLASGKRIELTGILSDNVTISTVKSKFAFSVEGVSVLNGGITFQGITFVKMGWKDATTLALYDSAGKEYIVKDNGVPLLDINLLWGSKYIGLRSEYKQINPGTSASGATILNAYHNNLTSAFLGFNFNYGRIDLNWNRPNKRLSFDGFTSQNGGTSGWTANITYSYTVNTDGSYKFTTFAPVSGNYSGPVMAQLDNFLKNNNVKFDYYTDNGVLYCKMSSVNDPTIVMTWLLK